MSGSDLDDQIPDGRSGVRRMLQDRVMSRRGTVLPPSIRVTTSPVDTEIPISMPGEDVVTSLDETEIAGLYLVTEAECPGCHEAMEEFMDDILDGTLKVVDVGDEKGFEIVQMLGLVSVPALVVQLKDGRYLEWKRD